MPDMLEVEYISSHSVSLISIQLRANTTRTQSQIPKNYRSSLILLLNSPTSNTALPLHQDWIPDHWLGPDCLSLSDGYVWPVHMDITPTTPSWPLSVTTSDLCLCAVSRNRWREEEEADRELLKDRNESLPVLQQHSIWLHIWTQNTEQGTRKNHSCSELLHYTEWICTCNFIYIRQTYLHIDSKKKGKRTATSLSNMYVL